MKHGTVACQLPPDTPERFGQNHKVREVWQGIRIAVDGVFIYSNGKLVKVVAESEGERAVERAARIDISQFADADFTSGFDPVEYLRRFLEGELER